jgi:hypothetical protein
MVDATPKHYGYPPSLTHTIFIRGASSTAHSIYIRNDQQNNKEVGPQVTSCIKEVGPQVTSCINMYNIRKLTSAGPALQTQLPMN